MASLDPAFYREPVNIHHDTRAHDAIGPAGYGAGVNRPELKREGKNLARMMRLHMAVEQKKFAGLNN
jgi:hypothetical protein